jgi:RimJ/RimL family protein N-acetyltransferase
MEASMNVDILSGSLVRLAAIDAGTMRPAFSRWFRDSGYQRLLDNEIAVLFSPDFFKEWFKDDLPDPNEEPFFAMHTLAEDRLIGFCGLHSTRFHNGDAFVGIGIGEPEYRGCGYGTDAMRVLLRYAFQEIGLYRVSLTVFDYNPRAIRAYEKVGFRLEGRVREALNRDGSRTDIRYMGILKPEWEQMRLQPEMEPMK